MHIPSQVRLPFSWLALSIITLISWWLGASIREGSVETNAALTVGILAIAAVKVRVIFREFMDVRRAPVLLKCLTDAWLGLSFAVLIAVYLIGSGV